MVTTASGDGFPPDCLLRQPPQLLLGDKFTNSWIEGPLVGMISKSNWSVAAVFAKHTSAEHLHERLLKVGHLQDPH